MANRERKNELKIYLSDKEQYILEQKVKISGMKSEFKPDRQANERNGQRV